MGPGTIRLQSGFLPLRSGSFSLGNSALGRENSASKGKTRYFPHQSGFFADPERNFPEGKFRSGAEFFPLRSGPFPLQSEAGAEFGFWARGNSAPERIFFRSGAESFRSGADFLPLQSEAGAELGFRAPGNSALERNFSRSENSGFRSRAESGKNPERNFSRAERNRNASPPPVFKRLLKVFKGHP